MSSGFRDDGSVNSAIGWAGFWYSVFRVDDGQEKTVADRGRTVVAGNQHFQSESDRVVGFRELGGGRR